MNTLYGLIGLNYTYLRNPDPQIAQTIESASGDAKTILNVGPIPHVCLDGLLAGYWRRPAAHLPERVRAIMSSC
ncbi:MAG: hypothetical protein ACJATW_000128 [Glaciecola sp.]|jgi:hypothetical protein